MKDKSNNIKPVGRIVATEKNPSTAQSFSFWTDLTSPVGIGTIVKALDDEGFRTVYGIVTEGVSYTDLEAPMHDYISSEGNPQKTPEAQTLRPQIRYYTACVLKMEPEEPIQPVSIGSVYLADEVSIKKSLRMDEYADKTGIPIGLYINGDNSSPVYLDSKFLLGPEAAHLNVTGVSGLATKTSIIEFLLSSTFQHYKGDGGIAAVLFNVKGSDLLFLDQKAENLSADDIEKYQKLGMKAEAFDNVHYYAPCCADRCNLNTLRTNENLSHNVNRLSWGLKEIFDNVEVLMNKDDVDAKADAFLSFISQEIIDKKINSRYGMTKKIENFIDLREWFEKIFLEAQEEGKSNWGEHALPTIRKIYNRLINIANRCKGLVTNDSTTHDLPWGKFEDKGVYVVDVANVIPLAQDLVFTRVVEKLKEQLEREELGVKTVIVFVDELNKYASTDSGNSYLKQTLLEISERGRYLGLILFSAQQFKSQVHKRIVGNCGTSIYGRMDMDELASQGYSVMPSSIKAELTVLKKGKLLIRHPHFNQYIFVEFPKPAVMASQDGMEKFPQKNPKSFEESMVWNFKRLDKKLKENDVISAISGVDKDEVLRAFSLTELKGREKPLEYFKKMLKKTPPKASFADTYSQSPSVTNNIDDWLSE